MALVSAISNELTTQQPSLPFDTVLYNKIIEAANLIVDECRRERIYATSSMTPEEWLESDEVKLVYADAIKNAVLVSEYSNNIVKIKFFFISFFFILIWMMPYFFEWIFLYHAA